MRFLCLCLFSISLHAQELRWFKGNTHTHSLWSDGNDFPEMIAAWYKEKGYDFLALSDHNTLAEGDKWVSEAAVEKKRIALGQKVLDKYVKKFGRDWVETREGEKGGLEIRLKTLAEYRQKLEVPSQFLLMQAEEVSASFKAAPIHINALNLKEAIQPLKDVQNIRETLRANLKKIAEEAHRTGQPVIAHLNHPNFRWALTADDLAYVVEDKFFEIYNGHPGINYDGDEHHADAAHERLWDIANTIRLSELNSPPLFGVGTDDSHHYHGGSSTSGRGWIMVQADKLEASALIAAMNAGRFYASSGVTLDEVTWNEQEKKLSLQIHAQGSVRYRTEFRGTRKNHSKAFKEVPGPEKDPQPLRRQYASDIGELLATSDTLQPTYTMKGDELYVRAIVISDQVMENPPVAGHLKKAWTQPVGWKVK